MKMEQATPKEREEELYNKISIPSVKILKIEYHFSKSLNPVGYELLELEIPQFASRTGNRIFIPRNILKGFSVNLNDQPRKNNFWFYNSSVKTDSIEIQFPAGFKPETIPTGLSLDSPFASFNSSSSITGNHLMFSSRLTFTDGEYPAQTFVDLLGFLRKIIRTEKSTIVLQRQ